MVASSPFAISVARFTRFGWALILGVLGAWVGQAQAAEVGLHAEPLASLSGPRGATMFSLMPSERTGVVTENPYADPKMWGEHYQEYSVGAIGTGVAVGDYDNDGKPDLFVVSKTGPCRLFRNLGNWKFEDATAKAGLGVAKSGWRSFFSEGLEDPVENWKQGASFADVNNDGWLDLYVCRFGAPNWLFVNQGNGTFREEAAERGLAIVDGSCVGAFCDYDRDGWLDVYLLTNLLNFAAQPGGRRDRLFRNEGDGRFVEVTDQAGIHGDTQGHSATWWDYNEDGWPDLYAANDFAPPDALYENQAGAPGPIFRDVAARVLPHSPYSAMGSDLGDVNNDGRIDFLVADMAATTHEKDLRGMADSRARSKDPFDDAPGAPQILRSALYVNTGTGRFIEAACLAGIAATDWTWSVRWEDLDNDGRLDLHVTNGMTREFHNSDFIQRVMLTENLNERMRMPRNSPELRESNLAFRNLGDLRFEPVGAAWGLDQFGVSFGAAFGDFDGDGDLDLVFANHEAGATMLRNDCDTGRRLIIALRGTASNRFGVGATVRIETAAGPQVRQLVLTRGYLSCSEPVLHFGLGEATHVDRLIVDWPSGQQQIFRAVAADQFITITEPAASAATLPRPGRRPTERPASQFQDESERRNLALFVPEEAIEESNQQPLLPFRFNRRGPALAVGDLNGDEIPDVVIGGTAREPAQTHLGIADGRFAAGPAFPGRAGAPIDDGPIVVFDANGDGNEDVLQTTASTALSAGAAEYQPRLLLNDGHGQLSPAPANALPSVLLSVGATAIADFDQDGRLDVFLGGRVNPGRYPQPTRSALLVNRGGRFEDVTEALAPGLREAGLVTSALWTDADDDGWLDLLLALEWGEIRFLHNNQGRRFEDRSEAAGFAAAGSGWWTSLAAADFNHDGRLDYVAGNVGLNTPYRASPEEPAVIYYGMFRDGNTPLLIEAKFEAGKLFPGRTRKDLGVHVPAVMRRFSQNDTYARATLEEIVGADRLGRAQRFVATEFQSGVFLSQRDGSRRFMPLPRLAQIAPAQGIAAGDFDGDGHADIVLAQNAFAPIPYIGRFGGGLGQLLRGDGHGGFTCVPHAESGLVISGDAKALVVLDFERDGWPDLLVSRNNAPALAWRNGGIEGRKSLHVRLRGPAGNPHAIGARISIESADGSIQTAELHAGSGYYSQSSPGAFFGYRAEAPPRVVRVRWPDRSTSEHAIPAGTASVLIPAR